MADAANQRADGCQFFRLYQVFHDLFLLYLRFAQLMRPLFDEFLEMLVVAAQAFLDPAALGDVDDGRDDHPFSFDFGRPQADLY